MKRPLLYHNPRRWLKTWNITKVKKTRQWLFDKA